MAYNGSGTFVRLFSWVVDAANTLKIRSDRMDQEMDGFATGLSNCVTRDGQSPATADLPMGTNKHTGVGNGTARNHYAALGQVQDQTGVYVGTVGGTADAITLTSAPVITAYAAGQRFEFIAGGANTGAVTVNVSGLGAKAVTKEGATALIAGDIPNASLVTIRYDGTRFQIVSVGGAVTKQATETISGDKTFSGSSILSGDSTFTGEANLDGPLALGDGSELTVATGSITPTANYHRVDTEADGATDDLTDIDDTNMQDGALLLLRAENTARTVVVKNGTGTHKLNLDNDSDFSLDDDEKSILLRLQGGEWYEVTRSFRQQGVIQTVTADFNASATGTGIIPYDDTVPQNTEGDEYMTLAITPTNASNKLVIEAQGLFAGSTGGQALIMALFQDSTASALSAMGDYSGANNVDQVRHVYLRHEMTAGTTSATTFKIRAGHTGSTTTTFNGRLGSRLFGDIPKSFITITEIVT